jgi:uncharacterized membrane protein YhaH (DUF805 family)
LNYFLDCYRKKYVDFSGRAGRSEYWYFVLFYVIIYLVLFGLGAAIGRDNPGIGFAPAGLFALASLLPSLAVTVRRFHDTGKSGWFILLGLIPAIGGLIVLYFMIIDSDPNSNQYGPPPSSQAAAAI